MDTMAVIERLRPHLVADQDYIVIDYSDGNGPQLSWYANESPPKEEEMEGAWLEVLKSKKKTEMKHRAIHSAIEKSPDPDVESLEDLFLLIVPALYLQSVGTAAGTASVGGETPKTDLSSMVGNFEWYYEKKAQIEAATSEEEIAAVSWED